MKGRLNDGHALVRHKDGLLEDMYYTADLEHAADIARALYAKLLAIEMHDWQLYHEAVNRSRHIAVP